MNDSDEKPPDDAHMLAKLASDLAQMRDALVKLSLAIQDSHFESSTKDRDDALVIVNETLQRIKAAERQKRPKD